MLPLMFERATPRSVSSTRVAVGMRASFLFPCAPHVRESARIFCITGHDCFHFGWRKAAAPLDFAARVRSLNWAVMMLGVAAQFALASAFLSASALRALKLSAGTSFPFGMRMQFACVCLVLWPQARLMTQHRFCRIALYP